MKTAKGPLHIVFDGMTDGQLRITNNQKSLAIDIGKADPQNPTLVKSFV